MRYYLDTEFDESAAKLISLGIVAQDGREFYAVNNSWERAKASPWLAEHVVPQLFNFDVAKNIFQGIEFQIARELNKFIGDDDDATFFGYKSAWDIVLVHRLFGGYQGVLEAGANIPLVCYDLHQIAKSLGIGSLKDIVKPLEPVHHALVDARWNKLVHEMIIIMHGREL